MKDDLKPSMQCDKCGAQYQDSIEKQKQRKRAFPCGQPCECGGRFCLHVNGKPAKKRKGGEKNETGSNEV